MMKCSLIKRFKLQGCIKPIEVDDKIFGLPNAVATYGVSPKCVWWYPCQASPGNPPCVSQAVCEQHGVDHFTCKCDSDLCINPDYAEKYKVCLLLFFGFTHDDTTNELNIGHKFNKQVR